MSAKSETPRTDKSAQKSWYDSVEESAQLERELAAEYQRGYDMALDMASLVALDYKWQKGSSNFNQGFMAGKILSMKSKTPAEPAK